jgi:hypothetical protein
MRTRRFVRSDEQQHTIVFVFLAELPIPEQFVGVGLDVLTLQRIDGGYDKLDAGLAFKLGKLAFDCVAGRRAG